MTIVPDAVFVTRKWAPAIGGMETWAHKLSNELAKFGPFEVIALPGRANGLPPTTAALLAFPVKVAWRYFRRRQAPLILHVGDMALWPVGLLTRFRRGPTCIILSAHGTDVSYPRRGGLHGWLYGRYLRLGARLLSKATVIANSRATEKAARESGWNNVRVVPLATDMTGPPPDGSHAGSILFVGRLIKQKGCAWFIHNVLPKLPKGTILCVAGTALDKDERSALETPSVEYLGSLRGQMLVNAYRNAMCVIVPNIELANGEFEGFGLVATEAAAAGGVVLAARCGGLPEAVVDGKTGFLVTSGHSDHWAEAIDRIARWTKQQRMEFVNHSMVTAKEQFSWPRVATGVVEIYREAVGEGDL